MQNEFGVFAVCVAVGFLMGIIYEPFCFLRKLLCRKGKRQWISVSADILYFALFSVVAVFTAYTFAFPSFRVYMWIGYALGGIIYLKSLHRILAFLQNVCYNRVTKMIKKAKKREKTLKKREKLYDAR